LQISASAKANGRSIGAAVLVSSGKKSDHDDPRADIDAAVQIDHVLIAHPDAAGRDVGADGPGLVGTVDAIERRSQIHRAGAERILRAAFHVPRQIGAPRQHFRRRRPRRPFLLRRYLLDPRPGEAGAADADAVAQRLAVTLNQEQKLVWRVDHDRAGAFPAVIIDQLLFESRIERPLLGLARIFLPAQPLLRFELREQRTLRLVGWLLLIAGLLLIALTLRVSIAEQELDETAAHI